MDSTELSWLSELELENSAVLMDECDLMDSFDDEVAALLGSQELDNSCSSSPTLINIPSCNSITTLCTEPPPKLHKPNNYSNFTHSNPTSSTPIILNFDNPTDVNPRPLNPEEDAAVCLVQPTKRPSRIRPPSQTYDHIVAERKRREQLSQRFMALSTIVPGLKKMDKTSVLGEAIKYLKQLQERVKTLEEQTRKQTMESVVLVKRSQVRADDDDSSELPEIEARLCDNHILLRLHCEKHKGVLINLLSKVEKLNLAITHTHVTQFGTLTLDITIIAEMEKDFNLTVKEVVKRLRAAL
ncbi:hypothetical protein ACS0TY_006384 [Phlomoides rotata]